MRRKRGVFAGVRDGSSGEGEHVVVFLHAVAEKGSGTQAPLRSELQVTEKAPDARDLEYEDDEVLCSGAAAQRRVHVLGYLRRLPLILPALLYAGHVHIMQRGALILMYCSMDWLEAFSALLYKALEPSGTVPERVASIECYHT